MTVSFLSAVFLSEYDFTGISSVLGIIVILKNVKTVPNQTLSRRNGIMNENLSVLFSIRDPINSDNIPNTTGRNAAPPRLQALIVPPLSNSSSHMSEGCP